MNQKLIGIIVTILGISALILVSTQKINDDKNIQMVTQTTGSCFLEDGTCLHDRSQLMYIFGGAISISLIVLGVYLIFFDKTQSLLAKQNKEVSNALLEAKKNEKERDEFNAFLSAFSAEEQMILKAVREQDGILQSTLRFRVGMSKAYVSMILSELEDKNIISRKASGKSYQLFLQKKF